VTDRPKLQVVYRPIASLLPSARNARSHPAHQIDQLVASIKEFGFTSPVLIDEAGEIIAGHGRVLAAQQIKLEQLPTITLSGLTDVQKRAYMLADNRIALNSGWDAELLAQELQALADQKFDLTQIGFGKLEVEHLLTAFAEPPGAEDAAPWDGMPSYEPQVRAFRSVTVHLQDADAVRDFERRMEQQLTDKTKYIYHPFKPREDRLAQAWVEDDDAPAASPIATEGAAS
jgi:ParB family chromosome partitioning protein